MDRVRAATISVPGHCNSDWRMEAVSALMPNRHFGEDIKEMMARHLTFEEAVASPDFTLMAKQRLRIIEIDVRKKLRAIL